MFSARNPSRHRLREASKYGGLGHRRTNTRNTSPGAAALKAGGAHNTMNQFG